MNLRERFDQLTPARKKTVIWSMVGIIILIITITGYNSRSGKIEGPASRKGTRDRKSVV